MKHNLRFWEHVKPKILFTWTIQVNVGPSHIVCSFKKWLG